MYVPSAFRLDDDAAWGFVARQAFALLLSADAGGAVEGTHLPVAVRERGGRRELLAHLSRANGQWKRLDGAGATLVFQGAHGYVSPTWYAAPDGVPTWNYVAVHVRGRARLGTRDDLLEQMDLTAAAHEPADAAGARWSTARLPADLRERLLAAVVPVVVEVEAIDAKAKLSQNRGAADLHGVLAALAARGDADSLALAAAMRAAHPSSQTEGERKGRGEP